MQPVAIAGAGFDGVTEGMSQIEQGAPAAFTFIGGDDFCLDRAGALYGIRKRLFVARSEPRDVLLQPVKEAGIMDQPVFDDFCQSGSQLPLIQRIQRVGVDYYTAGLMEGPDHVFSQGMVDTRFTAYRGIDLRQKCGRYLQESHAPLITGGGKAGDIADDPSAQGNKRAVAVEAVLQQTGKDGIQRFYSLVLLSIGKNDGGQVKVVESSLMPSR